MATIVSQTADRDVSIGRILNRAIAAFRGNALLMMGTAIIFGAIPYALAMYGFSLLVPNTANPSYLLTVRGAAATAAVWLFELLLAAFVQAAIIHATLAHSEARRASLGECLEVAASIFIPMAGLSLLLTVGLTIAFVLLIIPGLMVWCVWFVAKPALVAEREGIVRAFGRTRKLTAFEGWRIFSILLILLMTGVAASQLARFMARAIEGSDPLTTFPVSYILLVMPVTILRLVLWSTVLASTYVELRDAKDGCPTDRLQEVFG